MNPLEQFITSAGLVSLVKAGVDFLKYIRAKDTNGWFTQLAVWALGVGVVLLAKASDFAPNFPLGQITLEDANTYSQILAGLGVGAAAMLVNDFKKAIDRTDSAAKPDLIPPAGGDTRVVVVDDVVR